jgi:hypothetical protein
MYNYTCDTYNAYNDSWFIIPVPAVLPRPHKTLGRRLCGHNTTTPQLDFRLCPKSPV